MDGQANPKPTVTIYAYGYVGQAVYRFLSDHYDLQIVNRSPLSNDELLPAGRKGLPQTVIFGEPIQPTKYAVVCTPTPMGEKGKCDTSIVEAVFEKYGDQHEQFLIKSTIPPGTTDMLAAKYPKLRICFSPEYIGEGHYTCQWWKGQPHPTDMKLHQFQIFGGARENTNTWVDLFQRILGPDCTYAQTDAKSAEFVKYMVNDWGATKVMWANEKFEQCKAFGIDYREVRELWALDGRVEKMHTAVFPDKRGFGGKCFTKDIPAIYLAAKAAGYDSLLARAVIAANARLNTDPAIRAEYEKILSDNP